MKTRDLLIKNSVVNTFLKNLAKSVRRKKQPRKSKVKLKKHNKPIHISVATKQRPQQGGLKNQRGKQNRGRKK